jgi:AcrR family transcriptional regulator
MARKTRVDTVLDVAAVLFADRGFAATSVRQVAEGAALTKAGLYYHIREKEDLLFRICEHTITSILDAAEPAIAGADTAPGKIRAIIEAHLDFFREHPDNLVVINRDRELLSPARRALIARLERRYLDLVRGVLRGGQKDGSLTPCDPTAAAFLLLSMLNHLDVWYDSGGKVKPDELPAFIGDLFLQGVAAKPRK